MKNKIDLCIEILFNEDYSVFLGEDDCRLIGCVEIPHKAGENEREWAKGFLKEKLIEFDYCRQKSQHCKDIDDIKGVR